MMMKSVFWWRKPEYPEETTDLRQVTDATCWYVDYVYTYKSNLRHQFGHTTNWTFGYRSIDSLLLTRHPMITDSKWPVALNAYTRTDLSNPIGFVNFYASPRHKNNKSWCWTPKRGGGIFTKYLFEQRYKQTNTEIVCCPIYPHTPHVNIDSRFGRWLTAWLVGVSAMRIN